MSRHGGTQVTYLTGVVREGHGGDGPSLSSRTLPVTQGVPGKEPRKEWQTEPTSESVVTVTRTLRTVPVPGPNVGLVPSLDVHCVEPQTS